jgi:O-antigen ligase
LAAILLVLQSLVTLPLLVLMTKGTVVALATMLLAAAMRRQHLGDKNGLPLVALILLFAGASAIWAVDPSDTLAKTMQLAAIFAAMLAMRGYVDAWSESERETLIRWSLIGWGVAATIPAIDAVLHKPIVALISAVAGVDPRASKLLSSNAFVYKNCAVILTLTGLPVFAELLRRRRWILLGAAAVLLVVAILYTGSSSALMALFAGILAWGLHWLCPRAMRWAMSLGVVAMPLAMPLVPMLIDRVAVTRAIPHFPPSFYQRLEIWNFALERIRERPILGWGFDAARAIPGGTDKFQVSFQVPWMTEFYETSTQFMPLHPHNGGLQIWLELGGVGALLLAFVLWRLVRTQVGPGRESSLMAGFVAAALVPSTVAFGIAQSWWLALLLFTWATIKALPVGSKASGNQ